MKGNKIKNKITIKIKINKNKDTHCFFHFLNYQQILNYIYFQLNLLIFILLQVALKRLQKICDKGFISVLDFKNNPLKIFAAHELASIMDPAMATKMTVQFNLFGGTVLKLGTERHHKKLLEGIDSLQDVGCFGLTELGYVWLFIAHMFCKHFFCFSEVAFLKYCK